jgi:hypothetical protein
MARPMPSAHPLPVARLAASAAAALLVLLTLPATALPALGADRDGDGLRDAFEQRYGLTRPGRADSDRDGVVDSAEDLDGDRLGNLGEQRFGTHPGRRDSDADGTPDGAEDADRDGTTNARQQDARPIPAGLTPSLSGVYQDGPRKKDECFTKKDDATLHPCAFGDTDSRTTIVTFGDSHANHWLPALERVGKNAGLRIVMLTKGGCPSVSRNVASAVVASSDTPCATWRERALRWITAHPPAIVIISNAGHARLGARRWQAGMAATLARLPARSMALVMADTPRMAFDPTPCLRAHPRDMSACVTRRGVARDEAIRAAERTAAAAAGALFRSPFEQVCTTDPCPLVQGRKLIYRGRHHLTATIARQLAPTIRRFVDDALDARATSGGYDTDTNPQPDDAGDPGTADAGARPG